GLPDPHFWLDPVRVDMAARYLADELQVRVDTGVEALSVELAHVQAQVDQMLADIPPDRRKIVTGHDFLAYFAERFGLEVVGVIVPGGTHHAEPSSEHLAEIVDTINREMITTIFIDAGESRALAEAVAAEADHPVEIVELQVGAIPDLPSPAIDIIRITGERIAAALAG
ncbi:MAG: metal ABC transporter substrate-binding protein, partial [Acidimicrobiia bacterium]|nr:metal ABC transporter substrate-binding protein [Acidimicrobiia bacterium]